MLARGAALLMLLGGTASAHDVSVDVSGTLTTRSANNPRAGAFGLGLAAAYDFNDVWSLTGMALWTRDLGTHTAESSSSGGDIFLVSLGAMWLPTDSLMTMLTATLSPPSTQRNATSVVGPLGRSTDVSIVSHAWSAGAVWSGTWSSLGSSDLEHAVDVTLGLNRFDVFQQLDVPQTPGGKLLRQACDAGRALAVCPLVWGATSPLWQGRFGLGYTATIFTRTDVGLDGAYFIYDTAPSNVGYFSVLVVGRELGSGVPISPLQVTVRPQVMHRLGPVALKVSYQYGLYTEGLGSLHLATLRASWKVTKHWRASLSVSGQVDVAPSGWGNPGGQALLGASYLW